MTKTQVRARARALYSTADKILDLINELMDGVQDLQDDLQETADDIEPYENADELTEQQEERLEWFNDKIEILEQYSGDIDTSELDDLMEILMGLDLDE